MGTSISPWLKAEFDALKAEWDAAELALDAEKATSDDVLLAGPATSRVTKYDIVLLSTR
jgi:hypothetical protein